ncbi:MAG: hypothetical protein ACXVBW_07085 [Bdellovibrionota bacterium]
MELKRAQFAFLFLVLAAGCAFRVDHEGSGGTAPAAQPGSAASVTFTQVNDKVFKPSCVSCHGSAGGVSLENYTAVKKSISVIQNVAIRTSRMPPTAPLSSDARALLSQWISAGAPEGPPSASPTPRPSPSPSVAARRAHVSFASVSERVLGPRCVSCHGNSGGLSLEGYEEVKSSLPRITQAALTDKTMPPDGSLTDQEREILSEWISAGAPERDEESPVATPSPTPGPNSHHEHPPVDEQPPFPVLSPVGYAQVRDRIFSPRCVSCHSGRQSEVNLESFARVKESLARVAIAVLTEKSMPPSAALTREETRLLTEWIKAGAPENAAGDFPLPAPTVTVTVTPVCPAMPVVGGGGYVVPSPSPSPSARPE